jgi:hypothetical protein
MVTGVAAARSGDTGGDSIGMRIMGSQCRARLASPTSFIGQWCDVGVRRRQPFRLELRWNGLQGRRLRRFAGSTRFVFNKGGGRAQFACRVGGARVPFATGSRRGDRGAGPRRSRRARMDSRGMPQATERSAASVEVAARSPPSCHGGASQLRITAGGAQGPRARFPPPESQQQGNRYRRQSSAWPRLLGSEQVRIPVNRLRAA